MIQILNLDLIVQYILRFIDVNDSSKVFLFRPTIHDPPCFLSGLNARSKIPQQTILTERETRRIISVKKEERDTILVVDLKRHGLGRDRRACRTRRALLGDAERGHVEDLQVVGGAQQEGARARRQDETGQSSRFPSK